MPNYYGNEHIFTSKKGGSESIVIRAGQGETLNLEGVNIDAGENTQIIFNQDGNLTGDPSLTFDSETLNVPNIVGSSASGSANNLYSKQTLQHSDTTNLQSQGTSVSLSDNVGNNYLVVGGPNPNILGGVGIFKSTIYAPYAEIGSALLMTTGTTLAYRGTYSDINEDGDMLIYTDKRNTLGQGSLRKRTGETWTETKVDIYGVSVKCSQNYIIAGQYQDSIDVYLESSGTTTLQQQLRAPDGGASDFIELLEIIDGNTACYIHGNIVYLWSRSGTVWTNFQTISTYSAVTLISLAMYGNKLIFSSSSNTYVFTRASFGNNYTLSTTIANSNITSCTVNSTFIFVSTTSVIKCYDYEYAQVGSDESATLVTQLNCNEYSLVAGRPTFSSNAGNVFLYQVGSAVNPLQINNKLDIGSTDLKLNSYSGDIILDTSSVTRLTITESGISTWANATDSTSISTGSVILTGGLGVAKAITATTYNSVNNAFKLNMYTATATQSISAATDTRVLLGTDVLTEIPNLTKSTVSGGSRFTTTTALRLFVSCSVRFTSGAAGQQIWVLINDTGVFRCVGGSNNFFTGSGIISLAANDYFSFWCYSNGATSISNNSTSFATSAQFYSLN